MVELFNTLCIFELLSFMKAQHYLSVAVLYEAKYYLSLLLLGFYHGFQWDHFWYPFTRSIRPSKCSYRGWKSIAPFRCSRRQISHCWFSIFFYWHYVHYCHRIKPHWIWEYQHIPLMPVYLGSCICQHLDGLLNKIWQSWQQPGDRIDPL